MAWTTPGTAVAGDVLTAAFWNSNVRDNLAVLRAISNVQSATSTDASYTQASTTYSDVTNMTVTITPVFSTSKILLIVSANFGNNGTGRMGIKIVGGNAANLLGATAGSRNRAHSSINAPATQGNGIYNIALTLLDAPATTSPTTYKVQAAADGGTMALNRSTQDNDAIGVFRTSSTITAIEIPQ